ncbi:MAG: HlyD family efflux transporter periplasmic adaptor subunit [Defluviitaleaceae bacterium]|nr:HlyD family efflux transporter periplasmic adaptor subunit [Defluviitaleaceae bacterium]
MKKKIKIIFSIIIVLVGAAITITYATGPLSVEVFTATESTVTTTFTERGYVREDNYLDVFALFGGEIVNIYIEEGQQVNVGQPLVRIDNSQVIDGYVHNIGQLRLANAQINAQLDNLDLEELRIRDEQIANRRRLEGDLIAISVQQDIASTSDSAGRQNITENINLQNILIEQNRVDLNNAKDDLERQQILYSAGTIPLVSLEAAQRAVENYTIALDANLAQLDVIKATELNIVDQSEHFAVLKETLEEQIILLDQIINTDYFGGMRNYFLAQIQSNESEIAHLESEIARNRRYSVILSPAYGIVSDLYVETTNIVTTQSPVVEIRTIRENLVETFVPTNRVGDLQVGDQVEIIFTRQNSDVIYLGNIYEIDTRAEIHTSVLGVEERRVEVLIEPIDNSPSFISNFDVDVRFTTRTIPNVFVIPRTAIQLENDRYYVFIAYDNHVTVREVEVEAILPQGFVISNGISDGDLIVVNSSIDGLYDGAIVVFNTN